METADMFNLLQSNDGNVEDIKSLIHENLSQAKDSTLLNALVDFYIATGCSRSLDILVGIREPHDKQLFDKIAESVKGSSCKRLPAIMLLAHLIRKQPSWLHRIAQHNLFTLTLKILKNDFDVPTLVSALLALISLFPVIPATVSQSLTDILEIFGRLASWNRKRPAKVPEEHLLHLHVAVYCLFHKLFSMYPCNFVHYLRNNYCSTVENLQEFRITIKPMFEKVRMHPMLVTSNMDSETSSFRWKKMETHDIVVECARISLDFVEGTREAAPTPSILSTYSLPFAKYASKMSFYHPSSATSSSGERSIQEQLQRAKERIVARPGSLVETAAEESQIPTLSSMLHTPPQQAKFSSMRSGTVQSRKPSGDVSLPTSPRKKDQSVAFLYPEVGHSVEEPARQQRSYVRSGSLGGAMMALPAPHMTLHRLMDTSDTDSRSLKKEDCGKGTVTRASSRAAESSAGPYASTSSSSSLMSSASYAKDTLGNLSTEAVAESGSSTSVEEFDKSSMRLRSYSHGKQGVVRKPQLSRTKGQRDKKSRSWPDLTSLEPSSSEEATRLAEAPRLAPSPGPLNREQPYEQFYRYAFPPWTVQYCVNCQSASTLEENSRVSAKPETTDPVFLHLPPAEILDRHILLASALHGNSSQLAGYWNVNWGGNYSGKPTVDEMKVLQGQVLLLHNQVLFERHNKEMHAERSRRLMGKAKLAFSIEEENKAMKDQMRLQEKEISDLTANLEKVQKQLCSLKAEKYQECKRYKKELKEYMDKVTALEEIKGNQSWIVNKKTAEIGTLTKDLHRVETDLFNKRHDLEAIRKQVSQNEELRAEVAVLNEKLLTMGELLHRYQEKVTGFGMLAQLEEENTALKAATTKEVQNLRMMLDVKESQLDTAKRRVHELEATMIKKDQLIIEQKKLLRDSGEGHDAEMKAVNENYNAQRSVWVGMETDIMELQQQIESCRMVHRGYNSVVDPANLSAATPANILKRSQERMREFQKLRDTTGHIRPGLGSVASDPISINVPTAQTQRKGAISEADFDDPAKFFAMDMGADNWRGATLSGGALEPVTPRSLASLVDMDLGAKPHSNGTPEALPSMESLELEDV